MSQSLWGDQETQFFFSLRPETILDAVESLGFQTTGRCMALNSMENRVFEVEIEEGDVCSFLVAKFYRPGRWSFQQITEEHEFLFDLEEGDIPAIAPLKIEGKSLFTLPEPSIHFCVFPRKGGRSPQDMGIEELQILGRLIARMHNIGASKKTPHRLQLTSQSFGMSNLQTLLSQKSIPAHLESPYQRVVESVCKVAAQQVDNLHMYRIHGDCHWGNLLYRESEGYFFIDFDDMITGPSVQDLWLIIPGQDEQALSDRAIMIESYQSMRDFDYKELQAIEALRALRYIHFSAWISKRWEDPSFQRAFPHFSEPNYWQQQVYDLEHQLRLMEQAKTPTY